MKSKILLIPAAALLAAALWAGPASAHAAGVSVTTACVDGIQENTVTWANDFDSPATVAALAQTALLTPLGTATLTASWSGTKSWTVTWADGFVETGTVTADPLEGCVPPMTIPPTTLPVCPERVNGPSCPRPTTTTSSTVPTSSCPERVNGPTCPLPRVVATSIPVDVSLPPAVVEADVATVLAYTGASHAVRGVVFGVGFLIVGGGLVAVERAKRRAS